MHTNALAREKSPYLLQHAHNPVDWHPWGEDAFRKARDEDKPIFLSIGYSTCHWCHVMERESFEDPDLAEALNRSFVPVKVDREERPDLDRVYMTYVQATTGSGGWPMSVFLTPDLKPFFGGTYFPPQSRYGQPGFGTVLERVAEVWRLEREAIRQSSADVLEQLREQVRPPRSVSGLNPSVLDSGFYAFRRQFDSRHGGFGGAPKFPRPAGLHFLMRYYARNGNAEALEMVLATLNGMARGGIRDHLGGGFHRYSVDERWFVPHFEKMLYDQAQLAIAYLEGFQASGDAYFAEVARSTLDYVLRDMTHLEGGFYSAEDADSADPARPEVKREGAFYLWTPAELAGVLGESAAARFAHYYGVQDGGNVASDPHGEFAGRNILFEASQIDDAARAEIAAARHGLLEARALRPRPHLDDKVLTCWNGLMISAFARAAQVFDDAKYLEAARRAAEFLLARLAGNGAGPLLRRYRDQDAAIPAFLDDYAFFVQSLLDLYESSFELSWLEIAMRLAGEMVAKFEDTASGGFFSTAGDSADLVLRMKDDYDGAEPSGNSIAILSLLRLAALTGTESYRRTAERALEAFQSRMAGVPEAVPQMLSAAAAMLGKPKQIVIAGNPGAPDTRALLETLHRHFLPEKVVIVTGNDAARAFFAAHFPALGGMERINGAATVYVCENYTCQLPTSDAAQLDRMLQRASPARS
jgi:uncharacterized protein